MDDESGESTRYALLIVVTHIGRLATSASCGIKRN